MHIYYHCPCQFSKYNPISRLYQVFGVEKSDLRIDLLQTDNIVKDFNNLIEEISNDQDVEKFTPKVTSQYKLINEDGVQENIIIETGDFSMFPLEYIDGFAPKNEDEIALSYLNSKEFDKTIGDQLTIIVDEKVRKLTVSGIYQDVTNGGRTAKGLLPFNHETAVRYEVSLDVKSHVNISEKMETYSKGFYKVTDINKYIAQTFGNTIHQLKIFSIIATVVAIFVSILITTLFLKMLVAKDADQIAIMKSIGFSLRDLKIQYHNYVHKYKINSRINHC